MNTKNINRSEWIAGILTIIVAILVWAQVRLLPGGNLTMYDLFPVFGLIAFGLMWTHFIYGALRRYFNAEKPSPYRYGTISSGIVLAMIILHPALLWFKLWLDGFGLPPESYLTVYSSQLLAVVCGSIGLGIFLAYELKRFFHTKAWWNYIEYLQVIGMIVIFYHALQLGGELNVTWFRTLWWVYFISLICAAGYSYYNRKDRKTE